VYPFSLRCFFFFFCYLQYTPLSRERRPLRSWYFGTILNLSILYFTPILLDFETLKIPLSEIFRFRQTFQLASFLGEVYCTTIRITKWVFFFSIIGKSDFVEQLFLFYLVFFYKFFFPSPKKKKKINFHNFSVNVFIILLLLFHTKVVLGVSFFQSEPRKRSTRDILV